MWCVCILVLKYRRQVLVLVVLRPQTHPNVMLLFHRSSCQRRLHVFFLGLDSVLTLVLTLVLISTPLLDVLVLVNRFLTNVVVQLEAYLIKYELKIFTFSQPVSKSNRYLLDTIQF